jgi:hypothetical protein
MQPVGGRLTCPHACRTPLRCLHHLLLLDTPALTIHLSLLQLLALVCMEQPVSNHPDDIRDEKCKLLRAIAPVTPQQCLLGQYVAGNGQPGYRDDPTVPTGGHSVRGECSRLQQGAAGRSGACTAGLSSVAQGTSGWYIGAMATRSSEGFMLCMSAP